jgi:hypothetical protein
MMGNPRQALQTTREALDHYGLLLLSDASLPSVVTMIAGEPLHGSWWGHPLGGVIYRVSATLEDDPSILTTKLVGGKVTYVHRRLWPAVFAVGHAQEPWQLGGLSAGAKWLISQTERDGEVQTSDLLPPAGLQRKSVPDLARELERRLLVHATEIHTPSGAHAKVLETWGHWADRNQFGDTALAVTEARRQLERAAERLSAASGGTTPLPWQAPGRRRHQAAV